MARIEIEGLEGILEELNRLHQRTGPAAQKMVLAGASKAAEERKKEAELRELQDNGDMIKSIRGDARPRVKDGVVYSEVYSRGNDKKGVRNAEKEYLDHYGYKSRKATHWIDEANKKGEGPAAEAMAKAWDEEMKTE